LNAWFASRETNWFPIHPVPNAFSLYRVDKLPRYITILHYKFKRLLEFQMSGWILYIRRLRKVDPKKCVVTSLVFEHRESRKINLKSRSHLYNLERSNSGKICLATSLGCCASDGKIDRFLLNLFVQSFAWEKRACHLCCKCVQLFSNKYSPKKTFLGADLFYEYVTLKGKRGRQPLA